MNERVNDYLSPHNESEARLAKLNLVIEEIISSLDENEKGKVKAIILYGSIARGEARESSDVDIHIDLDPYDIELFKKIIGKLKEQFPNTEFSVSSKNIIAEGRMGKLITAQKNPKRPASWKFLYSRSNEERVDLDGILTQMQQSKTK